MPSSLRILRSSDVEGILSHIVPDELLDLMSIVFGTLSANAPSSTSENKQSVIMPHRINVPTAAHTNLIMPARIPPFGTAIKLVSVPTSSDDTRGLPGTTIVMDEDTGSPKAIINARSLTAIRTAAGSALATRLVLGKEAQPLGILAFGSGAQIQAHLTLLLSLYPSIAVVRIANRSLNARAVSLLSTLAPQFPEVQFSLANPGTSLRTEISQADIIVCATSATAPLMGEDERFVKPGAHIILVGSYTPDMHEVSQELLSRTGSPDGRVKMNVVVDSRAACLKEAGELIGAEAEGDHLVEIGELLKLGQDGKWMEDEGRMGSLVRERKGEISVFKSVGVGVQDVAIAALVLGKAEGMGLGVLVEDYDV